MTSLRIIAIASFALSGCARPEETRVETKAEVRVLVFVRSDCPISNRYAPELERLAGLFARDASFLLVYPDPSETAESIARHRDEYGLTIPAQSDPEHEIVLRTGATVTPEVAVFAGGDTLVYRGRIDDRFPVFGVSREPSRTELRDVLERLSAGEQVEPSFTEPVGCFLSDLR
jgi:hypothetical protein